MTLSSKSKKEIHQIKKYYLAITLISNLLILFLVNAYENNDSSATKLITRDGYYLVGLPLRGYIISNDKGHLPQKGIDVSIVNKEANRILSPTNV